MRIIAGKYRSLEIEAPRGKDVRPTTDRVREGMFSSLLSQYGDLTDAVVLDAFAGSGALGIEALSRGAKHAIFCEKDRRTIQNLTQNLEKMHIDLNDYSLQIIDSLSDILPATTKRSLEKCGADKIDVVFLDPPYATCGEAVFELLNKVRNLLSDNAVIVYEHSADQKIDSCQADAKNFRVLKSKKYGKIAIEFISQER